MTNRQWASTGAHDASLQDDIELATEVQRIRAKDRERRKCCTGECGFRRCETCGDNREATL